MRTLRNPSFWARWQRWCAATSFVDALFKARFRARTINASAADQ
jgi:hypothetical protein